jgi:ABC-type transport system involved in cytochrome c biogenesis permease subunit
LSQWEPVGPYANQLYAIRPYSAHVPRAVTAFVAYLRVALAAGFGPVPASVHGTGHS